MNANTSNQKQIFVASGGGIIGSGANISINNNNNINNINMTCNACNQTIYDKLMSKTSPDNKIWHSGCLKCCECQKILDSKYFETSGRLYCRDDYLAHFGPSCFGCARKITDDQYFFSIKQTISTTPPQQAPPSGQGQDQQQLMQTMTTTNTLFFHDKCFACNYCSQPLQKGEKYCIIDYSPPPQQQQPTHQPTKTPMIYHDICALKYYSASSNNVQSNTSGSTGSQASLQANPPTPRAKRGRMKQKPA